MIKVSENYSKADRCKLCGQVDTQQHLVESCTDIIDASEDIRNNRESRYEDIYTSDVKKLKAIANLFRKALQTREALIDKRNKSTGM